MDTLGILAIVCLIIYAGYKILDNKRNEVEVLKNQEFEHDHKYAGRYISGHPNIDTPFDPAYIKTKNNNFIIGDRSRSLGEIPMNAVGSVQLYDRTTMEKRVTATRLFMIGLFAFAAKKTEVYPDFYITIQWNDGRFSEETVFEFGGQSALNNANALKNFVINTTKASDLKKAISE